MSCKLIYDNFETSSDNLIKLKQNTKAIAIEKEIKFDKDITFKFMILPIINSI